jgi:anti-sigma regulatory factor (Ser/Thr protein kinase)
MRIQLRAPQDRELLPSLFAAIDEAMARAGIAHALAHDVHLVSEEVVCNAIDHGQQPGREHEVTVEIAIRDDRVVLCFRDDGDPFDPLSQPPPDLEADIEVRPIGGLGVHLIRTLADEITYERESHCNVLRVVLLRPLSKD